MGYGITWQWLYRAALWSSVTASLAAMAVAFVLLLRYGLWGEFLRRGRRQLEKYREKMSSRHSKTRIVQVLQVAVLLALIAAAGMSLSARAQEDTEESSGTAPVIDIVMEETRADADGIRHYRADNAWIRVRIRTEPEEDAQEEPREELSLQAYQITVRGSNGTLEAQAGEAQLQGCTQTEWAVSEEEVAALGEGLAEIRVEAASGDGTVSTASLPFVLDFTPPVLTAISVKTQDSDGNEQENVCKKLYPEERLYYREDCVVTVFEVEEEHPGPWETCCENQEGGALLRRGEEGFPEVVLREEGVYHSLSVKAEDLAGNKLICSSDVLCEQEGEHVEAGEDGLFVLACSKILDRTGPEAVLSIRSGSTFYLYTDEQKAYCAGDFTVTTEESEEPGMVVTMYRESTGTEEPLAEQTSFVLESDDAVQITVSGQDRAGNPAVLCEKWETEVNRLGPQEEKENACSITLVRDTQAPVLYCAQKEPRGYEYCEDKETDTLYYSALPEAYVDRIPALAAWFAVQEENPDPDRMKVGSYYSSSETGLSGTEEFSPAEQVQAAQEGEAGPLLWWLLQWKPGDGSTRDGVYHLAVSGTDRAGNPIRICDASEESEAWQAISAQLQETPEVQNLCPQAGEMRPFSMNCVNSENGSYVSGARVVDTQAPEGLITIVPGTSGQSSETSPFYRAWLEEGEVQTDSDCFAPYRQETSAVLRLQVLDASPTELAFEAISTLQGGFRENRTEGFVQNNTADVFFDGGQIFRVQNIVLMDRAGNRAGPFGRTEDIYLDTEAPEVDLEVPTVSVRASSEITGRSPDGQPLYGNAVSIKVFVTDPGAKVSSSGLENVTYDLKADGEYLIQGKKLFAPDGIISGFADTVIVAATEETQTNDLEFIVHAQDRAGNASDVEQGRIFRFGIDTIAPVVRVQYDNNEAKNGHYFAQPRTATIEVTERNLDSQKLRLIAAGGKASAWRRETADGSSGDLDKWICEVVFDQDADCALRIEGTDALGNAASVSWEGAAPQAFTVDTTPPVLEVEFNREDVKNGRFYNHLKTVYVRVQERNFDPALLEISPFAGDIVSEGEVHTAVCRFTEDGEYRMTAFCTDLAGNQSSVWTSERFVIDTIPPTIEIGGAGGVLVRAGSGEWKPEVLIRDKWLSEAGVPLLTKRSGAGGIPAIWIKEENTGQEHAAYRVRFFPAVRENDGIWLLQCSAQDLAGNRTVRTRKYCINRYGSVFGFAQETVQAMHAGFLPPATPVVVTEANVSPNVHHRITLFRNGAAQILREEEQYASLTEYSGGKYHTQYRIAPECFEREGAYQIVVQTEDAAGNRCSSGLTCKVDRTAPVCRILGVDTDRHSFTTATLPLRILCMEDGEIRQLRICVQNEQGKITAERRFAGDEIPEEGVPFLIPAAEEVQILTAEASDEAGNVGTTEYSVLVQGPPFHAGSASRAKSLKLPWFLLCAGAGTLAVILYCSWRKRKRTFDA